MKDARAGIAVFYNWGDQDLIEITVCASNGAFSGTSRVFVEPGRLCELVHELAHFPLDLDDRRSITLGTFDPMYAGGGVSMSFKCIDRSGHACADIVMISEDRTQSVNLTVPIAPASVDEFVNGLASVESEHGSAVLAAETLHAFW